MKKIGIVVGIAIAVGIVWLVLSGHGNGLLHSFNKDIGLN